MMQATANTHAVIDVETEKTIVRNALLRLFNPTMTTALIEGFYSQNNGMPQFLDADPATAEPSTVSTPEVQELEPTSLVPSPPMAMTDFPSVERFAEPAAPSRPTFRLELAEFSSNYFAKDYFPKFRVSAVPVNGFDALPQELEEMPVTVSVHNKWAEVTSEVLPPHTELTRVVKNGVLDIADLMFMDVSIKHGGHFVIKVSPVDHGNLVSSVKSPRFTIQSVKTHCNKKRKARDTPATTMASPMPPAKRQDQVEVVNDMKSFLMPPQLDMDMDMFGLPLDNQSLFPTSDFFA
jgi:hypothetical protein